MDGTAFAQAAFCRVWAEAFDLGWEPLEQASHLGMVFARTRRLGLRNFTLAPRGLYWGAPPDLVAAAADQCRKLTTVGVTWSFRYDGREQLDRAVAALGPLRCKVDTWSTHVLPIEGRTLEEILKNQVKGVTRRQAGYARERGVEVRPLRSADDLARHDAMYRAWADSRGIEPHPPSLFPRLATELGETARMFGAFHEGELIAAILVYCDRDEWFYWHGVRDAQRDQHFAVDALIAHAVDLACRAGARFFNMGASSGIKSIEFFKERWGAEPQPVWSLAWQGPVWPRVLAGWRRLKTPRAEGEGAGRASGIPD